MPCVSVTLSLIMASVAHLYKPNSIDKSLLNILTVLSSDSSSAVDFYTVSDHPYKEEGLFWRYSLRFDIQTVLI